MDDRTTKYAKEVVSGNYIVGEDVMLACKRHLNDLKRSQRKDFPYYFNVELAETHINFFNLCNHSKGEWAGKPIILEPWQCFCNGSVFGWQHKGTGLRRFKKAYEQVARKNGKSTKAAGTGLDAMSLDGEQGAEVYSAATKRDQARIIFDEARRMVKASPSLRRYIDVLTNNLNMPSTNSKFEALSADAVTLDGLNIHFALIDELHAHKTRDVFDVLDTATGARTQPVIWMVTTAGNNRNGICYEVYEYARKVLRGVKDDETFFAYIAQPDEGDDPFDERTWYKANPNLGVSVNIDDLRTKANTAKDIPSAYNNFLCKHLNIWVSAETRFVDLKKWDECDLELPDLTGRPCTIGVDLASTEDTASVNAEFALPDGYYAIINHSFIPEETMLEKERKDGLPYSTWVRQGCMTATPGEVIDYDWIQSYVLELHKKYKVKEVCYDPWNATQFANNLSNEGLTCVEVRQGYATMSEPIKDMKKLIIQGKIIHGGNPVLRAAINNAIETTDPAGNVKIDKSKAKNKVDSLVAFATSHVRAMLNISTDINAKIISDDWGL